MRNKPFFSVITPVYNRARFVPGLVRHFLGQAYGDFELIIVDDGSTDETYLRILDFDDPRIKFKRIENRERGAARNVGAEMATGDYLNFFDSDDIPLSNHLQVARDFAVANQTAKWFHTAYRIVDEVGNVLVTELGNALPDRRLIVTNYLGCDSVFIRRDFFNANKFNEDRRMASSEDWQLWLRLIAREPLQVCQEITLLMQQHKNRSLLTISADRVVERDTLMLKTLLEDDQFVKKFGKSLPLFIADRYTFFALVTALERRRSETLSFLKTALKTTSLVLCRKRFWASLRIALKLQVGKNALSVVLATLVL